MFNIPPLLCQITKGHLIFHWQFHFLHWLGQSPHCSLAAFNSFTLMCRSEFFCQKSWTNFPVPNPNVPKHELSCLNAAAFLLESIRVCPTICLEVFHSVYLIRHLFPKPNHLLQMLCRHVLGWDQHKNVVQVDKTNYPHVSPFLRNVLITCMNTWGKMLVPKQAPWNSQTMSVTITLTKGFNLLLRGR